MQNIGGCLYNETVGQQRLTIQQFSTKIKRSCVLSDFGGGRWIGLTLLMVSSIHLDNRMMDMIETYIPSLLYSESSSEDEVSAFFFFFLISGAGAAASAFGFLGFAPSATADPST